MNEKFCLICGKEIVNKKHPHQKYCSHKCAGIAQRKGKELVCDYCGKRFYKAPTQVKYNNHTFCSNECRYLAKRGNNIIYYENNYAYMLLTKGTETKKVLFDKNDVEKVNQYKWHLHYRKKDNRYDCCTNTFGSHNNRHYMNMPKFLLDYYGNLTIDHINRNSLDNRRSNLRVVTQFENNQNKGNNKSGCVGVCWDKNRNKWHVTYKSKNIGRFDNFQDAVKARKQAENLTSLENFDKY